MLNSAEPTEITAPSLYSTQQTWELSYRTPDGLEPLATVNNAEMSNLKPGIDTYLRQDLLYNVLIYWADVGKL